LYCVKPSTLLHGNAADLETGVVTVLLLCLRRSRSDCGGAYGGGVGLGRGCGVGLRRGVAVGVGVGVDDGLAVAGADGDNFSIWLNQNRKDIIFGAEKIGCCCAAVAERRVEASIRVISG
jgi:hypothetical protein